MHFLMAIGFAVIFGVMSVSSSPVYSSSYSSDIWSIIYDISSSDYSYDEEGGSSSFTMNEIQPVLDKQEELFNIQLQNTVAILQDEVNNLKNKVNIFATDQRTANGLNMNTFLDQLRDKRNVQGNRKN
ncbi:uncharacterized protein LOC102807504 [Saccoglossus kowalevskii]|uniref:Uncharacterized protein n=1 Tax=Saccoglossus kowalevskii TaxID=10224 RepID=A0ABM0LW72_SACKO|nr:PREDICTED: putative uncharacterized protein DDB_G0277255-like isoform X2 [Saccoglossus kowalevskii]